MQPDPVLNEPPPLAPFASAKPSAEAGPTPLPRSRAWTCAAVNVFAFPGFGTIMARKPGGYIQAVLSALGFLLFMWFLCYFCYYLVTSQLVETADPSILPKVLRRYGWAGMAGSGLCVVSWIWALLSSIDIVRESSPARVSGPSGS